MAAVNSKEICTLLKEHKKKPFLGEIKEDNANEWIMMRANTNWRTWTMKDFSHPKLLFYGITKMKKFSRDTLSSDLFEVINFVWEYEAPEMKDMSQGFFFFFLFFCRCGVFKNLKNNSWKAIYFNL